jgi:hypothetical protein
MTSSIRPTVTDPAAMMRDGYHEPESVFPPPPVPILEGDIEDRAFEILQLIVGIYRVSKHETVMGKGVSWAAVQRWYNVGGSREMRNRIYASISFLVNEGYLREGRPDVIPPPGLNSDSYIPTEKGYDQVDRIQSRLWERWWQAIEVHKMPVLVASSLIVVGVSALVGLVVRVVA